jgi:hypothetical protein
VEGLFRPLEPNVGAPENASQSLGSYRLDPEAAKPICVRLATFSLCWLLPDEDSVGMSLDLGGGGDA